MRVTNVAGFELHPPRAPLTVTAAAGTRKAPADPAAAAGSEAAEDDASVDGGGEGLPPPPPVPAELMDTVGTGVISVSPRGLAVVEHLGRGVGSGSGSGGGEFLQDEDGIGGGGSSSDAARRAAAAAAAAAPQQGASTVSLWRLRAARRRRQARGNKMRALVGWAAGEDVTTSWSAGGDDGRSRERGGVSAAAARGSSRMVGSRSGALMGGEGGRAHLQQPGGAAGASYLRRHGAGDTAGRGQRGAPQLHGADNEAGGGSGGRQALGWGSALQARALALPASFLPKRA